MTLGLFAPLPLPVMIPFMGFQSLVMGEAFGLSYQYAKRKISAMSNDEFNKLTIPEVQRMLKDDIQSAIPTMAASMKDMQTLQTEMIQYAVNALAQLPSDIYNAVIGVTGGEAVVQGEQGLPLGVAGFLRPILEPGIGGLKHSAARIVPEPSVIPSTNIEHDAGMFAGDVTSTGGVELAQYPRSATVTEVHASQLERFRAAAKIQQDKAARELSNFKIEQAKLKTNPTIISQENELIKLISNLGAQLQQLKKQTPSVPQQIKIQNLTADIKRYNSQLSSLVSKYKRK